MQLEVGKIYEGKVTGITKFGAFVDLGDNITGMVHISEVAPTFVKEITDYVTMGQTVKVRVLNIGEEGKVSLSIKRAADPAPASQSRPQRPRNNSDRERRSGGYEGGSSYTKPAEGGKSFEDMLSKFMQRSDEKMSDLKKSMDSKRGSCQERSRS